MIERSSNTTQEQSHIHFGELVEQVANTGRAYRDFHQALSLSQDYSRRKLEIGTHMMLSGFGGSDIFSEAVSEMEWSDLDFEYKKSDYKFVADCYLDLGNISQAEIAFQNSGEITTEDYLKLARYTIQQDGDPSGFIERAITDCDVYIPIQHDDKYLSRQDSNNAYKNGRRARQLLDISRFLFDIGEDPVDLLIDAQNVQKYVSIWDRPELQSEVAIAYAYCGNFKKAIELIESMQSEFDLERIKKKANRAITHEALKHGDISTAFTTAKAVESTVFLAQTYAHAACVANKRGEDNNFAIESENLLAQTDSHYSHQHIKTLMFLAQNAHENGDSPDAFFQRAMELIRSPTTGNDSAFNGLSELANMGIEYGYDVSSLLNKMKEIGDEAYDGHELGWMDIDQVMQGMYWEETTELAIKLGSLGHARRILPLLEKDEEERSWYVHLLSLLAKAEADRGLTPEQLRSLPAGIIRQLQNHENEDVREAMKIFTP